MMRDATGDDETAATDAEVDGICILANYSEQFALADDERER